jgi:hypothetical protein
MNAFDHGMKGSLDQSDERDYKSDHKEHFVNRNGQSNGQRNQQRHSHWIKGLKLLHNASFSVLKLTPPFPRR